MPDMVIHGWKIHENPLLYIIIVFPFGLLFFVWLSIATFDWERVTNESYQIHVHHIPMVESVEFCDSFFEYNTRWSIKTAVWWVFNHVFFILFQASNSWHRIMIWLFYLSSSSSQQTFKTGQPSQTTLRQQLWQDRTKATAHRFPIAMATPEYVSCHRTSWREGVRVFTCMSHHFLLYSN